MLNCDLHRSELQKRVDSIRAVLAATHSPATGTTDISREARGLVIVLLYASYENLLTSLCRSLLEAAVQLRVGNRRLKPGLKVFAVFDHLQAATDVTPSRIWRGGGLEIVDAITHPRSCTIDVSTFPSDGSHMKRGQLATFCTLFSLGEPGPVLREIWNRLDTIVDERNGIAHGRLTADEVGRNYSVQELANLADLWLLRWSEFLAWVESQAATRDFFRLAR